MSKKKKALAVFIIVAVLALVITLGIGSSWFTNSDLRTWFGKGADKDRDSEKTTVEIFAVSDTGDVMLQYGVYEMPASMTIIPNDNSQSTSSGEVTLVTKLNSNVSYIYYFENPVSTWASGKAASDFITVKPVGDKGEQVKIISKNAFGEPIIVQAIAGNGETVTCKLDYLQSITSNGIIYLGGSDATDEANIESEVTFGLGTVKGTVSLQSARLTLADSFKDKVIEYLNFDITFKDYCYDLVNSTVELLDNYYDNHYIVVTDGELRYSMFIKGFDSFTQNQKDAVYFAWYKAHGGANVYIDIFVNYSYKGNLISKAVAESDIFGGQFTGYSFYSDMFSNEILHDNATN